MCCCQTAPGHGRYERLRADEPDRGRRLDLTHRRLAPVWGGEPEAEEGETLPAIAAESSFARGHTEQLMRVTGTVTIDDSTYELGAGTGLRDHSWGPRYWQAVWWYRWLTINLGPDLGMVTTILGSQEGGHRAHGFVFDRERYGDDRLATIREVDLRTDYDDQDYHQAVHATVTTDDATYEVDGDVWSNIPLRNRREGLTTRITEGMTTWHCGDLVGSGLSEYLDQIIDGRPVGRTEA